jgi:hypothetical protein
MRLYEVAGTYFKGEAAIARFMVDVIVSERGRSFKGRHDTSSGEASHLFEPYDRYLPAA